MIIATMLELEHVAALTAMGFTEAASWRALQSRRPEQPGELGSDGGGEVEISRAVEFLVSEAEAQTEASSDQRVDAPLLAAGDGDWQCAACTFSNTDDDPGCGVCGGAAVAAAAAGSMDEHPASRGMGPPPVPASFAPKPLSQPLSQGMPPLSQKSPSAAAGAGKSGAAGESTAAELQACEPGSPLDYLQTLVDVQVETVLCAEALLVVADRELDQASTGRTFAPGICAGHLKVHNGKQVLLEAREQLCDAREKLLQEKRRQEREKRRQGAQAAECVEQQAAAVKHPQCADAQVRAVT